MTMQISAQLNNLRIAPRKVRIVAKGLRGLDIESAKMKLRYINKRASHPIEKLLNSAMANAQNNKGLDAATLYIKDLIVNEGVKLKRFKPKGFGMVMPIQKKTSHIKVVLDQLSEDKAKKVKERLAKRKPLKAHAAKLEPESVKKEKAEEKIIDKPKFRPAKEIQVSNKGVFGGIKTLGRKMFRRKSI